MLKSALDGSVYAPRERPHLRDVQPPPPRPGVRDDNLGAVLVKNELHHGEAVEEKISLSGRFGIWVGFHAFSQDEYVAVARQWVAKLRPPRRPSPGRIPRATDVQHARTLVRLQRPMCGLVALLRRLRNESATAVRLQFQRPRQLGCAFCVRCRVGVAR